MIELWREEFFRNLIEKAEIGTIKKNNFDFVQKNLEFQHHEESEVEYFPNEDNFILQNYYDFDFDGRWDRE